MKSFTTLREDLSFTEFMDNKKVAKGIRKKSSIDLRDRQFAIELEFDPEQFGYGDLSEDMIDEIRNDFLGEWDETEHQPEIISEFFARMRQEHSTAYYSNYYATNYALAKKMVFAGINAMEDSWNDNMLIHEDVPEFETKLREYIKNAKNDDWTTYFESLIVKAMPRAKYNDLKAKAEKNLRYAKKLLNSATNSGRKMLLPGYEQEVKRIKSRAVKFRNSVKDRIKKYTEKLGDGENEFYEQLHNDFFYDILQELDGLIDEWIEWFDSGRMDKFEEEFQERLPYLLENYQTDINQAVDNAQDALASMLKIDWEFKPDGTPAVELTTGPLTSKDMGDLYHDLEILSEYNTSPNLSCHIHIEKGKNFGDFEKLAILALVDEETITENEDIIGWDRYSYLDSWARNIKGTFPTSYSTIAFRDLWFEEMSVREYLRVYSTSQGYSGVVLNKMSTKNKTVEFRYPSSTLLDNYKQILTNIQYFMALISVAKRKNVIRLRSKLGSTYTDVITYIVRDKSYSGGGWVKILLRPKNGRMDDSINALINDINGQPSYFMSDSQKEELVKNVTKAFVLAPHLRQSLAKSGKMSAQDIRNEKLFDNTILQLKNRLNKKYGNKRRGK